MLLVGDAFGKKIADLLGVKFVPFEDRKFTDGELCPRIEFKEISPPGSDAILAINKHSDESINDYTLKAYFLARTLHNSKFRTILVFPYFSYARQDNVFRYGEPLSSNYVAQMFDPIVTNFVTVTAHLQRRTNIATLFDHAKTHNVSGIPALIRQLPSGLKDPYILGPDTESIHWAREMADLMGVRDYGAFTKKRDVNTGEIQVFTGDLDLKDRQVVVVDDMISTGGTVLKSIKLAREAGAREIHVTTVHPILAGGALDKIKAQGVAGIIGSNTMESPISVADVTPDIVEKLKEFMGG
ncbi:MAG TPA: ribose-phosphate diphosphokinase [archaeon]|nr:ribose-phosphate diphosphokinase [archaeon]